MHDPTHQLFVVVAEHGWLDLLLDFKTYEPNLEDIRRSYGNRQKLDRVSKYLTDNVAILVETRRQYQNERIRYVLNVCVINVAPAVLPIQYAFSVSFSSANNTGFSIVESYPDDAWEEWDKDTMNLLLDDVSDTGILCFRHEQDWKRFAVTFGFHDKTVWSDVCFLKDTEYEETARDICSSYRDNQK
ncbi:hypothetical protein BDP27DRAFT_1367205 [Rhodocollybia butyracea]|uniref:Uncharacterized protein n=1 Tax=Rhodocollybia butyracea TaxID=206335 RepID=A0A9P5U2A4_9AGAR|nr:hypothetical protein BDP27DRAFT_1367205 [Rhodocollybia butyracea]